MKMGGNVAAAHMDVNPTLRTQQNALSPLLTRVTFATGRVDIIPSAHSICTPAAKTTTTSCRRKSSPRGEISARHARPRDLEQQVGAAAPPPTVAHADFQSQYLSTERNTVIKIIITLEKITM